ncbi:NAD-dependent epimerase [uncultured Alistipes sp.]|jgi:NAD-binding protein|uniref:NAD-dependent epimerase n=1 Tax=uncultured Alistipes sp. TaxID=538949 RepID=UPI0025E85E30|nr:NAD-dependent epimerase [uncultured Alistipes sp.]
MNILVTGAAGFIGSKLVYMLASRGDRVVGIDNINDYYDPRLKYGRLREIGFEQPGDLFESGKVVTSSLFAQCSFIRMSIDDREQMEELFRNERFDKVVNLAAQAGVRYSITNPYAYAQSNLTGFMTVLECCRHYGVKHLVFASSSSVYGIAEKVPFSEDEQVDRPVSLYAATKKANELMAHSYSKLYGIAMTGLRYFTVYGPWGRPDMAPMLFARAISRGEPIEVFNNGNMVRDFTYIDDIAYGTVQAMDHPPLAGQCPYGVAYKIYNIGCSNPVKLMDFIGEIEQALGRKAEKQYLPMQPGDVHQTYADTSKLEKDTGYKPHITLHEGITRFMEWYKSDKNPIK